jgi:hypothetical protein
VENLTLFKLSGDILKYLIDIYKNYNFSISNFIHVLKVFNDLWLIEDKIKILILVLLI